METNIAQKIVEDYSYDGPLTQTNIAQKIVAPIRLAISDRGLLHRTHPLYSFNTSIEQSLLASIGQSSTNSISVMVSNEAKILETKMGEEI